ncbi:Endoglucanase precursor [Roseivivax jejudonensis]|uniref:cellulase n=1 Tax=Roseivivax jejudonensis TaxID=1529041 RepID=A0A1X6ZTA0_9RHOB|nr:glycosyl hydrolase family 8 [Roseivivax jejudonensis]SLN60238.1 Endoglucanase precursor [Roseivivax jejudonensis]
MDRRIVLQGLGASALAGVAPGAAEVADAWTMWKARFLRDDGRVVDAEQGGISHSEGQAYALLLAQAAGDRAAFGRIEEWTRAHLLVREDALMAWRWTPGAGVVGDDWHNATDGDLFRAWALLRARRDSGWEVAAGDVAAIVADLSVSCLWPDPRAGEELILRPGAEAFATDRRVLFNPSYIMPRALRELAEAAGNDRLMRAADHGETCLSELAARDMMPDWIDVTADGFAEPTGHDLRSAYDALRISLYLVWSGRRDHPAVRMAQARLAPDGAGGAIVVARDARGVPVAESDLPGYLALARLVACGEVNAPGRRSIEGPYYAAVLHMLAGVATREGASCASTQ